jgi:dTDP-4-amino-4,6-dideoxygalactose transaminase
MKKEKKIFVTRPTLPSLSEFYTHLENIWESKWLTNNGPYHQKFEKALCEYFNVNYCNLCTNGTLALMIAIKSLSVKGEVITTPFSFVATAHAIHWNGCKPVFCDIEEKTLNINPEKIESLITPKTKAILPVHVYGNPCDVKRLDEIAERHGIKIIYDAAHAFGTTINGRSILEFGDASILSFHATKIFSTIEGGAIFSRNEELKHKNDLFLNFGFSDEETVLVPGLNAKMNEIQAAYGLVLLSTIKKEIEKRRIIGEYYREKLKDISGIELLSRAKGVDQCYSYFPILIKKEIFGRSRDEIYLIFKKNDIYVRKYFYPLISHFEPYKNLSSSSPRKLSIAEKASKEILCLPIYGDLGFDDVDRIIKILASD